MSGGAGRAALRMLTLIPAVVVGTSLSCTSREGPPAGLRSIYVESLSFDRRTELPVILLKERDGDGRELPIWIGMPEAQSIAMALEEMDSPRPNTHDLIKNLLVELEGDIQRIIITELRGHTYYAVIRVRLDGKEVSVDSRPSDAIAVAIRTGAPLFATDRVLDQGAEGDDAPALDIRWPSERPLPRPSGVLAH